MKSSISFTVNKKKTQVQSHSMARLLDVLRNELALTGTKEGCGEGECGACSVLLDGKLVNSCLVPMLQVEGAEVLTIEGLQNKNLEKAFLECGGAQCGICTPGMVMAAHVLLEQNAKPSEKEVKSALAGNLCRCTGYMRIFEAVKKASETL